jgi:hypothetical protein
VEEDKKRTRHIGLILVGISEGMRPLGRLRRKLGVNIKIEIDIGWSGMD